MQILISAIFIASNDQANFAAAKVYAIAALELRLIPIQSQFYRS